VVAHTLWTSAAPALAYWLYADEWHLNHTEGEAVRTRGAVARAAAAHDHHRDPGADLPTARTANSANTGWECLAVIRHGLHAPQTGTDPSWPTTAFAPATPHAPFVLTNQPNALAHCALQRSIQSFSGRKTNNARVAAGRGPGARTIP
jgi:hypothetical protein